VAGMTEILAELLVRRAPALKRQPSVKQMLSMAYTRSGKRGHRSWRKVAADLGVAESTLRRWRHGESISTRKLSHLQEVTQAARPGPTRRAVPPDHSVVITWTFDGRTRDVAGANLALAPGTLKACQEQFMAGDDRAATRTFLAGIGDPWYQSRFSAHQEAEEKKEHEKAVDEEEEPEEEEYEAYYDDLYYEDAVVDEDDYFEGVHAASGS